MSSRKAPVFVREATGLVREFSWFDGFAITWSPAIVFSLMIAAPAVGLFPGTNPFLALCLLVVLSVFYSINFGWLGMAMPRSGGTYVFNSRVLHPMIGFLGDWIYELFLIFSAAIIFNLLISWTLVWFLSSLGLTDLATMVTQPIWLFVLGTTANAIALLLNLFRKGVDYFFKVTIVLSLVGAAVLLPILFSGLGSFPGLFTSATGVDYNTIIPLAIQNGFSPDHVWSATILTLAWLGPFYLGFGGVSIGGEMKNVKKSMLWSTVWANLLLMVSYMLFTGGAYLVTGYTWYNALSWLFDKGGSVYPLKVDVSVPSIAGMIVPSPWLGPLVAFAMLASMASQIPVFHLVISRGTFMWSFDRLLPQKYTEVSDRLHVPVIALVSVTIFVEFALALTSFTGLYGVWVNASWMGAIVILISALSGIVLPYRKKTKSIYESAPAVVRTKVVGVPLVTIGGLGTLAFVLLFFGTAALSPTVSPVTSTQALSILIWCIIGVAFFYVVRYYRLRQGLDLSMAFAELPPE